MARLELLVTAPAQPFELEFDLPDDFEPPTEFHRVLLDIVQSVYAQRATAEAITSEAQASVA